MLKMTHVKVSFFRRDDVWDIPSFSRPGNLCVSTYLMAGGHSIILLDTKIISLFHFLLNAHSHDFGFLCTMQVVMIRNNFVLAILSTLERKGGACTTPSFKTSEKIIVFDFTEYFAFSAVHFL